MLVIFFAVVALSYLLAVTHQDDNITYKTSNKLKTKFLILLLLTIMCQPIVSQTYPTFGPEIKVTITGLTFDAMEPFISVDGTTLFFNSLNSGGNTNLYYASKVNDSTFTYLGLVGGCYDPSSSHLDAVASLDSINNFYWTSLRSVPNLYRGVYHSGNVNSISKVYGTCNILSPGWIIMDAAINFQGNLLYYSNGYFGPTYTECAGVPCESILAIAQKVNDSTFNKTTYSDAVFSNVNDTNYITYAPQITKDGLELYYTRLLKGGNTSEICVAVRNTVFDTFSLPMVIYSNLGYFPEAASPTTDKQKIYYHQKDHTLVYNIYMRYRTMTSGINEYIHSENLKVYPNPTNNILTIVLPHPTEEFTLSVYSSLGQELYKNSSHTSIDISNFVNGIFFLILKQNDCNWKTKIIKE